MSQWDELARRIGYADEQDMLYTFYIKEGMSISEISKRINAGTCTVARRLDRCGVEKRGKGGANAVANQSRKVYLADQRVVFSSTHKGMADLLGVSKSIIYKYIRHVKGGFNDEVRDNLTNSGFTPVFPTEQLPSGTPTGPGSRVREILRRDEGEG